MKTKNRLLTAAAAAGVGAAACVNELYRYVYRRTYSPVTGLLLDKDGHDEDYYAYRNKLQTYMENRPHTEHSIRNEDGIQLRGFYYPCGHKPSKVIVFMIHGYRSEHNETCGPYYDYYMSRGIDIFTCDHAAHGESSGDVIGYGLTESRDCLKWLEYILNTFGRDKDIILHGFSMGAAAVMMMSDQVPFNVRFIIEDSGYANARDQLSPALGKAYAPLAEINKKAGHYNIDNADVVPHLSRTKVPFLFVHGKADTFVPFNVAPELYNICLSEKDCLYVDDARHVESMYRAPREYKAKIDEYLRKYIHR